MNYSTIIGIDLAKNVFQVAVMTQGKLVSNQRLKRSSMLELIANTPVSTIAMGGLLFITLLGTSV